MVAAESAQSLALRSKINTPGSGHGLTVTTSMVENLLSAHGAGNLFSVEAVRDELDFPSAEGLG